MGKKAELAKRKKMETDTAADVSSKQVIGVQTGDQLTDELNEPTMGEKLASLNLVENVPDGKIIAPPMKPPSADSLYILLKQALRADDRALIIECMYRQDQKVIKNSLALLDPSDALKLLQYLVSIIHLRGSVVTCALPWLRSLLLQHSTHIISQEASLAALNSLHQLIESRTSSLSTAVKLSTSLDLLYTGMADDAAEENDPVVPAIYRDESEEEESLDFMDVEDAEDDDEPKLLGDISDGQISV